MKRLLYDVSRWSVYLHRSARGLDRDDISPQRLFEDELFERLFSGDAEPLAPEPTGPLTDWARRIHDAATELPDFARLHQECRGDADAAAMAVEVLMEKLQPEESPEPPPRAMRAALRGACAAAAQVVDEMRDGMVGLANVSSRPGEPAAGPALARRLRHDVRLRRVSSMAGRFIRIAAQKRRSRLRREPDEVTDVEIGGELARLIPAELLRLSHRLTRLPFLRDYVERNCLQFRLDGRGPAGKGPLVVMLDRSGSMSGPREEWSLAVSLALLSIAQEERRTFGVVLFDGGIKAEYLVRPGEKLSIEALYVRPEGGTDIGGAVARGLDLVQTGDKALRRADLVLITDGESDLTEAPALRERAAALNTCILGIGIDVPPEAVRPWCDGVETVSSLDALTDTTASKLFAA